MAGGRRARVRQAGDFASPWRRWRLTSSSLHFHRRRRRRGKTAGARAPHPPPKKKSGKCFFRANITYNSFILLIFHTYIFGQKCLLPKVDWAPTPMIFVNEIVYYRFVNDDNFVFVFFRLGKNTELAWHAEWSRYAVCYLASWVRYCAILCNKRRHATRHQRETVAAGTQWGSINCARLASVHVISPMHRMYWPARNARLLANYSACSPTYREAL